MPEIRTWRRLEPRCRAEQSDPAAWSEALKARVHDPLWFLARQLQFGEFEGEDAGSAVVADVQFSESPLDRFTLGFRNDPNRSSPPETLSAAAAPLEALVERESVLQNDDLRVRLGRYFETRLGDGLAVKFCREVFPLTRASADPPHSLWVRGSDPAVRFREATAGRVIDGGALVAYLERGFTAAQAYEAAVQQLPQRPDDAEIREGGNLRPEVVARLNDAGAALLKWYQGIHSRPGAGQDFAWIDERLEYQFSITAPAGTAGREIVLDASEYYHGELDWYAFTVDTTAAPLGPRRPGETIPPTGIERVVVIPAPVEFAGMPAARWWDFEDRQVNLGAVDVQKTELGKLILLEFALAQSNDWHLIPLTVHAGSLIRVQSLDVVDSFGETHRLGPAGNPQEGWSLFTLSRQPRLAGQPDFEPNLFFFPPSLPHVQESAPLEEVLFLRDEMANMVWAVERIVADDMGRGVPGHELSLAGPRRAREHVVRRAQRAIDDWADAREYLERLESEEPQSPDAVRRARETETAARARRDQQIDRFLDEGGYLRDLQGVARPPQMVSTIPQYRLFGTVPDNWIPFVPVPLPGHPDQISLQRYAMPDLRSIRTDDRVPERIRARGRILKPEKRPFFLFEEEVPRGGVRVVRTAQFVRSADGRAHFWIGRRKWPGRGEGSSGLRFDFLRPPST